MIGGPTDPKGLNPDYEAQEGRAALKRTRINFVLNVPVEQHDLSMHASCRLFAFGNESEGHARLAIGEIVRRFPWLLPDPVANSSLYIDDPKNTVIMADRAYKDQLRAWPRDAAFSIKKEHSCL